MSAALLARDLTIGMRTAAFAVVVAVHAALLAAFIVLWGGGVPMLPGANLYEQQRLVQAALLVCLLPWAAARCGPGTRGDDLVMLSALTAIKPSRIVLTQFTALIILLAAIVGSGFPLMLIARQMAAVPLRTAAADLLPALALALIAAAATLLWGLGQRGRLAAWLGATGSTLVIAATVTSVLPRGAAAPALIVIALAGAAACASRADVSLLYLSERR